MLTAQEHHAADFFQRFKFKQKKNCMFPHWTLTLARLVENCKPPTSSMHKYLVNWMVWRRQQCTSLKWGMPGRHVLSERCRNYLILYTEGCSWGRLQLPESLVIFTKQHRWFVLSDKADAVQFFPSVVTQSLVTNYCIGIVDSKKIPDLFSVLPRCSWLRGLDPHGTTLPSSG
jgi:hypothetical protein